MRTPPWKHKISTFSNYHQPDFSNNRMVSSHVTRLGLSKTFLRLYILENIFLMKNEE